MATAQRDTPKFKRDFFNVKSAGALGNGEKIPDANVSGSTLTSAACTFLESDVGKRVWIKGAGAGGTLLVTAIDVVVDAHTLTLHDVAGTDVTGAGAVYGTDDTVALKGAIEVISQRKSGRLYIPSSPGFYIFSETLMIPPGCALIADTAYLTDDEFNPNLVYVGSGFGIVLAGNQATLITPPTNAYAHQNIFENLYLEYAGGDADCDGFLVEYSAITMRNCSSRGFRNGYYLYVTIFSSFYDCRASYCSGKGIWFRGKWGFANGQTNFQNCIVGFNAGAGLHLDNALIVKVIGGTYALNGGPQIQISGGILINIDNVEFEPALTSSGFGSFAESMNINIWEQDTHQVNSFNIVVENCSFFAGDPSVHDVSAIGIHCQSGSSNITSRNNNYNSYTHAGIQMDSGTLGLIIENDQNFYNVADYDLAPGSLAYRVTGNKIGVHTVTPVSALTNSSDRVMDSIPVAEGIDPGGTGPESLVWSPTLPGSLGFWAAAIQQPDPDQYTSHVLLLKHKGNHYQQRVIRLEGGGTNPKVFEMWADGSVLTPGIYSTNPSNTDDFIGHFTIGLPGNPRWQFGTAGVESGGNKGSELFLWRYDDSANFISPYVVAFERDTGKVSFAQGIGVFNELKVDGEPGLTLDSSTAPITIMGTQLYFKHGVLFHVEAPVDGSTTNGALRVTSGYGAVPAALNHLAVGAGGSGTHSVSVCFGDGSGYFHLDFGYKGGNVVMSIANGLLDHVGVTSSEVHVYCTAPPVGFAIGQTFNITGSSGTLVNGTYNIVGLAGNEFWASNLFGAAAGIYNEPALAVSGGSGSSTPTFSISDKGVIDPIWTNLDRTDGHMVKTNSSKGLMAGKASLLDPNDVTLGGAIDDNHIIVSLEDRLADGGKRPPTPIGLADGDMVKYKDSDNTWRPASQDDVCTILTGHVTPLTDLDIHVTYRGVMQTLNMALSAIQADIDAKANSPHRHFIGNTTHNHSYTGGVTGSATTAAGGDTDVDH